MQQNKEKKIKGKGRGVLLQNLSKTHGLEQESPREPQIGNTSSYGGDGDGDDDDDGYEITSKPKLEDSGVSSSSDFLADEPAKESGRGRFLKPVSSKCSKIVLPSTNVSPNPPILTRPNPVRGRAKFLQCPQSSGVNKLLVNKQLSNSKENFVHSKTVPKKNEEQLKKEQKPVIKKGTKGVEVNAACNYIRLHSDPNKGVFEYEVKYEPNIHSNSVRIKLLNEHRDKFGGTKTFDGTTLYLPIQLSNNITIFESIQADERIEIKLIFKRKNPLKDCIHLYNVLFDRVMKTLNYVRCERKKFDPSAPKIIPQHKLEIWPGYITAVDEYEDGIMLCCDVSHRILSTQTVLEFLSQINRNDPILFQNNAKRSLIGSIVMTRYNNKTYRIDDIDFKSNPQSTFRMKDKDVQYLEYYKSHYDIEIKNLNQPLLISNQKRKIAQQNYLEEITFCLLPEITYLTGLSDEFRNDHKVLRDVATYTKVTPNQRILAIEQFYNNINSSIEAKAILSNWGLRLENDVERLKGRLLPEERVHFSKNNYSVGINADFRLQSVNNELLEVVNIRNWILIHQCSNSTTAQSFIETLKKISKPMGIQVTNPRIIMLNNDRTESYVNTLRQNITPDTQIVVVIVPTVRDDRYSTIKKICCAEIPVPSQVINAKTLVNESKNRSIVQKIALQINCKLGGTLWEVKIPLSNTMICGIDSYHNTPTNRNSVSAFVASLNSSYTKWYSRAIIQTKKEELVNGLCVAMKMSLENYEKCNGKLPGSIIIYRDGVGNSQLALVTDYEIPQIEKACFLHSSGYKPKITFVVVQKRINTRLFQEVDNELRNPKPGFIVDHKITRKFMYDFYLVSQSIREGTATPSHYIVLYDTLNIEPDIIQRLSYKLCFMYYNWPGSVKVPACCQYAHKLAYLVGENIQRSTSEILASKLFYL